jgi:hypothetical protein
MPRPRGRSPISRRMSVQRLAGERRLVLHREHDDARVRRGLEHPRDGRQARPVGHVEVEQEDVGLVADDVAQGLLHRARLGHDLAAGLALEQAA